jgi:hypothetical protein
MPDLGIPLSGGYLNEIPPNASREEQVSTLNDVIRRLNESLKVQSFNDGTNKRYINGYSPGRWPGGDFGLAISKPNEDVSSVEFDDLLFAWDYTTNKQYYHGGTQIFYDPSTGKDIGQQGILPDNTGGSTWAKPGNGVNEAYGVGGS